ncbi:gephyrin-like molybdotransferase Glp [Geobacter sp. DSM 9736]|uniref:molybdopterin molybdotransferase MoeA n=1 Tax=Geobacter sp. DSM 9736 TaxID=1277350 RepID=UPI000B4FED1B|nr:gephyrin-like molybdotransferase Glp [Geobacter sp. DSM 9736]SNB45949.1 molybdopterin molybdochelatase [Geobacter sp. DSM 9736]
MPTFEEARSIILGKIVPIGCERVPLLDAVGRVLAEDVTAPWDMPLYDNSAMDGFAVRAAECTGEGTTLRVAGFVPAGEVADEELQPGCSIRIMTGAPIPPGADAVVPVEETEERDGMVLLRERVIPRQHIRFRGEDVPHGETFATAGSLIGPPEVSMLASFGKAFLSVFRRARVAILSTGDELIELGETPRKGSIINSNALSLAAAVREAGAEPIILGIARDNMESHRKLMIEGLKADALITSAGVSAGDRDFVRDCLAELGVEQVFWKVDIKPGGPTAFGIKEGRPVFALPGNPVSTMITFDQFVRPALLRMMGHSRVFRPLVTATLLDDVRKKPGKLTFIRVSVEMENGKLVARTSGNQQTGILRTMLRANAVAFIPKESGNLAAGEEVKVQLLRDDVTMTER